MHSQRYIDIYFCLCNIEDFLFFVCSFNMSRPALPADNVHTIQLPLAGCSIPEGTICKMYGWGETKGTNILCCTLTTAVLNLLSTSHKFAMLWLSYCISHIALMHYSILFVLMIYSGEEKVYYKIVLTLITAHCKI